MTTPFWITGFEYGLSTLTANGGGLCSGLTSTPTISGTQKHSGNYALRVNPTAAARIMQSPALGSRNLLVGRLYFYIASAPASEAQLFGAHIVANQNLMFYFDPSTTKIRIGSASYSGYSTTTCANSTWHYVDFSADIHANPWVIQWKIDGNAETTFQPAQAADTIDYFIFGANISTTYDAYFDDVVLSVTGADYPIGPGGTQGLSPSGDGTHNAGTNVMEDNDGNDIGAVTAYDHVNSVPIGSTTTYIKQSANGTGNYAGVTFADISDTHAAIIGAEAVLAYRAASATGDTGGCIVTKDNFSTSTTLWGAAGALADYSESSVFYKAVIVSGVTDDTTVNALAARVGYSDDANPNPWWVDLIVEVAYTVSTTTDYTMTVDAGSYTLSGQSVTLNRDINMTTVAGSYSLTGNAVDLLLAHFYSLVVDAGSYALTGNSVDLTRALNLIVVAGSYSLTGNAATLTKALNLLVDGGSYALIGNAATLTRALNLVVDSGAYILTGNAVDFIKTLNLVVDAGSYCLNGLSVELIYTPVGVIAYVMQVEAGSYTLTGNAVDFPRLINLNLAAGSYTLTGNPVDFLRGWVMGVNSGAYSLTGNAVNLLRGYALTTEAGQYQFTGNAIDFIRDWVMAAERGTYLLTGNAVDLVLSSSILGAGRAPVTYAAPVRIAYADGVGAVWAETIQTTQAEALRNNEAQKTQVVNYG